ncbi:MAG: chemotaxis protein CheW [Deltaproteobacteria bacterium]|nr:chemotaxis protein CheW [Deltaproteobacteria bacterium]
MTQASELIVLLVEDSDIMRKMEKKILGDLGYTQVLEAADGQAAVKVLESGEPVDLIICDWNMPGMNGLELLTWVRASEKWPGLPFIMATARGEKKEVAQAGEAGVSAMVSKPFTPPELKGKIAEAMAAPETGAAVKPAGPAPHEPELTADGKLLIRAAHIQITDHLILGVLKHLIASGKVEPRHFALETRCMGSWNPVSEALESGQVGAALVLAPIAMDLFGYGVPINLVLLAHKNGSIFVRNRLGTFRHPGRDFFRGKTFYVPHRLSVHHMLSHMYMSQVGLNPSEEGGAGDRVRLEVVPPIRMPEFLAGNADASGYMVAEPLGTKAIAAGHALVQFLSGEVWPDHPCCVVTVRRELIDQYPAAVEEFVGLLVEAGKFIAREPGTAAEIGVQFLDPEKTLGLTKPVLRNVLTEPSGITTTDLFPVVADLELMQSYMHRTMGVGTPVDLGKFVNTSFAAKACGISSREACSSVGGVGEIEQNLRRLKAEDREAKSLLAKEGKYLTFLLGEREFGLPILKIKEVIGMMPIRSLPRLPEYAKGVINLRNEIIPVVDLRLRLGMPERDYDARTCIIVVEVFGRRGNLKTGLVTDEVSEVLNVESGDLMETPTFGTGVDTDFLLGMAKKGQGVKILLDIDRLFQDDAPEALAL